MSFVKQVQIAATDSYRYFDRHYFFRISGNFYAVYYNAINFHIDVYKSTDNGDTWGTVVSHTTTNSAQDIDAVWDTARNNIAIVYITTSYASGMDTVRAERIVFYQTSNDSFVNDTLINESAVSTGGPIARIAYDSTNDQLFVVHRAQLSNMGSSYQVFYLATASAAPGSTWTTGIDWGINESGDTRHTLIVSMAVDPVDTDRIHIIYNISNQGSNTYAYTRAATYNEGTSTLATPVAAQSTLIKHPIAFDAGSTTLLLDYYPLDDAYTILKWTTNTSRDITGSTTYAVTNSDTDMASMTTRWFTLDSGGGVQIVAAAFDANSASDWVFFQTWSPDPDVNASYDSELPWEWSSDAGNNNTVAISDSTGGIVAWDDGGTEKLSVIGVIYPTNSAPNRYAHYAELTLAGSALGPQTVFTTIDAVLYKTKVETSIDAVLLGSGSVWVPISDRRNNLPWTTSPLYQKVDEGDPISDADFISSPNVDFSTHLDNPVIFGITSDFPSAVNRFRSAIRITWRARDGGGTATTKNVATGLWDWTTDQALETQTGFTNLNGLGFTDEALQLVSRHNINEAFIAGDDIALYVRGDGSIFSFTIGIDLSGVYLEALRADADPSSGITGTWGNFGPVYIGGVWYVVVHDTNVQWMLSRTSPTNGESLTVWDNIGPITGSYVYDTTQPFFTGVGDIGGNIAFDARENLGSAGGGILEYIQVFAGVVDVTTLDVDYIGNLAGFASPIYDEVGTPADLSPAYKFGAFASNATMIFHASNYWASDDDQQIQYRIIDENNTSLGSGSFGSRANVVTTAVAHPSSNRFHCLTIEGWGPTGAPWIETISGSSRTGNSQPSTDSWKGGSQGAYLNGTVVIPAARVSGGVRCASFTSANTPTVSEQTISTRNAYKAAYEYKQTVVAVAEGSRIWVFWIDATNDAIWAAYQNDGETTWTEYGEVLAGGNSYTYLGAAAGATGEIGLVVSSDTGPPTFHTFDASNFVATGIDAILKLVANRATDIDAVLNAAATSPTVSHNYDFLLSQRLNLSHDYDFRLVSRVTKDHDYDFVLYKRIDLSPTINVQVDASTALQTDATQQELTPKGTVTSGEGRKKIYRPGHKIVKR